MCALNNKKTAEWSGALYKGKWPVNFAMCEVLTVGEPLTSSSRLESVLHVDSDNKSRILPHIFWADSSKMHRKVFVFCRLLTSFLNGFFQHLRMAAVKWPAPTITSSRQYIWRATNLRTLLHFHFNCVWGHGERKHRNLYFLHVWQISILMHLRTTCFVRMHQFNAIYKGLYFYFANELFNCLIRQEGRKIDRERYSTGDRHSIE